MTNSTVDMASPAVLEAASQKPNDLGRSPERLRRLSWVGHEAEIIALTAILLLASLLRVYQLGARSLWLDELTILRSVYPAGGLFDALGYASLGHPPLYLFLLRLTLLLGQDDWLVRMPAAIASVAGVAAVWWLGRTLFDKATGLVAALLLAVSPFHIAYAQEAHSYALYGTLSALMLWALYQAAQRTMIPIADANERRPGDRLPGGFRHWLGAWRWFILFSLLSIYTHYYAAFPLAMSALAFPLFLIDVRSKTAVRASAISLRQSLRPLIGFVAAAAVIGLLFLPQLIFGFGSGLNYAGSRANAIAEGQLAQRFVISPDLFANALSAFTAGIQYAHTNPFRAGDAVAVFVAVSWALALVGVTWLLWRRRALGLALLLWSLLPIPLIAWFSLRVGISFAPRRLVFALPVYFLFIAVGIMAVVGAIGWFSARWQTRKQHGNTTAVTDHQSGSTETPQPPPPYDQSKASHRAHSRRTQALSAFALTMLVVLLTVTPLRAYYNLPKQDWKTLATILSVQVDSDGVVVAAPASANNLRWYYQNVRVLNNDPLSELETLCNRGRTTYFALSPQDRLSAANQQWLSENFIEIPLKDVKLYYRQCGYVANDWYGAGAGPLFRMAITTSLPFAPTQRAYRAYSRTASELLDLSMSQAPAVSIPSDPSMDETDTSAMGYDLDTNLTDDLATLTEEPDVVPKPTGTPPVPPPDVASQDPLKAQETAVALALAHLTGSITPAPAAGPSRRAEAEALIDAGQPEQALAILQEIVASDNNDRAARMSLARALAATGKIDAALAEYKSISQQWPGNPWALVRRGELLDQAGDSRGALREFQSAVKVAPDVADVRFALAYALARSGQNSAAVKEFEAGLRLDPTRDAARAAMEQLRQQ